MRVGIPGSGLMGGTLGAIFARAGQEVVFRYVRNSDKLKGTFLHSFSSIRAQQPVLAEQTARKKQGLNAGQFLPREAKWSFYNTVGELNLEGSPRIKT